MCMRYHRIYLGAAAPTKLKKKLYELLEIGGVLVGMVEVVEEREADEVDDEAADSHGQQPIVIDGGRRRESAESLAGHRDRDQ